MTSDVENDQLKYKFKPGETGVSHRKFGPCSIIDKFIWNSIKFYEVRIHGTSTHIDVTESSLIKEQSHE